MQKLINAAVVFILFCPCVNFSCGMKLNLDYLLEQLWEYLALICIYTKKRGGMFSTVTCNRQNTTREARKEREKILQEGYFYLSFDLEF